METNLAEVLLDEVEETEITDRKGLATIERVIALEPIEGKDRIEFIRCQGYCGVVQKGLHEVGNLVLVVKHESIVPDIPMFEFMRDCKFRVKSKSFNTTNGKIYSQIIVIPLEEVAKYSEEIDSPWCTDEGADLTDFLGVKKYIPKLQNQSGTSFGSMMAKGTFPTSYISVTDEPNIQGCIRVLEELKGLPYYISLKCEGSSLTSLIHPEKKDFSVCSRKNMLKETEDNSFWYVAKKYKLEKFHTDNPQFGMQGELCGALPDGSHKVQGNVMGLNDLELFAFNIINLENRRRIPLYRQLDLCSEYNIQHVPVLETGESFDYTFEQLMNMVTKLRYPFGNKQIVEGIVIRPVFDMWSERLKDSLSVKLKNPEYDLSALTRNLKNGN